MSAISSAWWKSAIVYQIYPRSFQDTDGDGIGDLRGITDHLDYIEALGASAVWLSPIHPSPLHDMGYDVGDYQAIDPAYGSVREFDQLIEEARRRDIRVILDLVANHTSSRHPWFEESRRDRSNSKSEWYIWRDPPDGDAAPNNWVSCFGGSGWEWEPRRQQFYYHAFMAEQPDLNWSNPEVRRAIHDVMRFWMDRGVEGFRLDAIAHIGKHAALLDNPTLEHPAGTHDWATQEHLHDVANPVMHQYLRELRTVADEQDAILVGEIYGLEDEDLRRFGGGTELHSVFNFDLLNAPWSADHFRAAVERFEQPAARGLSPSPVLDNHDQPRSFSRYAHGDASWERARLLAVMLLTLRGSPYVYFGQELGMPNAEIPPDIVCDPPAARFPDIHRSRDPARTPMQWSRGRHAGFTTGEPWLPVTANPEVANVETQLRDPTSLLHLYRRSGNLRREHRALQTGAYRAVATGMDNVWAYRRESPDQRMLVILNFGSDAVDLDLSDVGVLKSQLLTTGQGPAAESLRRLSLPPYGAMVLELAS